MRTTLIILALILVGCAATQGSDTAATRSLGAVGAFTGVHTRDGIRVVIEVGVRRDVSIRADDNFIDDDLIAVEIRDEGCVDGEWCALDIFARVPIAPMVVPVVTIGVPSLDFVSAEGDSTEACVTGVAAGRFGVAASDGASVTVEGTCTELVAIASGDASLDGDALDCIDARIDAQGGSEVHATVTGRLEVRASGESVIHIHGPPSEVVEILTDSSVLTIE